MKNPSDDLTFICLKCGLKGTQEECYTHAIDTGHDEWRLEVTLFGPTASTLTPNMTKQDMLHWGIVAIAIVVIVTVVMVWGGR